MRLVTAGLERETANGVMDMAREATAGEIREAVRERYAAAAKRSQAAATSCCSSKSCGCDIDSQGFYQTGELGEVPAAAAYASLGCGNPTLLAQLSLGETVLDLGSGGGIDVLLSAKRVGSTGKAYGLDMTDEMLALARRNAADAGATNVEFLKGQIEAIPLPDASVDVIISNCVINLSADKDAVLREAFRVLRPGGRFAVADIVVRGEPLPPATQELLGLWAGCIAGAITEDEYRAKLAGAGFSAVEVVVLKSYGVADIPASLRCCVPSDLGLDKSTVVSAFVKASKPVA
jgi:SAM-dependent methyltransferase